MDEPVISTRSAIWAVAARGVSANPPPSTALTKAQILDFFSQSTSLL
jgi:hypothetical protein